MRISIAIVIAVLASEIIAAQKTSGEFAELRQILGVPASTPYSRRVNLHTPRTELRDAFLKVQSCRKGTAEIAPFGGSSCGDGLQPGRAFPALST
ncbi:MAG TPA: hypothetical protein VK747_07095 [Blastocatellia bacterium]|nr:hypothetical protein [Blastocatellia bacterium]